jgi:uncharacterized protein involved in oxidation of intracellular sulfur
MVPMRILLVLNQAPYGGESTFNALRLAMALQAEEPKPELALSLMGDAVFCALPNQMTPQGYYNIERMFKSLVNKGAVVQACSSCAQARGIMELDLIEGVEMATMPMLAKAVLEADKVISF